MTRTLLLAALLASCGGTTGATRTAYSVEVANCVSRERAIVDRTGTTAAQDEADLAAERSRCDEALRRVENGAH